MKNFVSAGLTLVVTTLMVTVSFGCGEGFEGEAGSQSAELSKGQCNSIVATDLRSAQRCARGQCGVDECTDVGGAFLEFFFLNPECAGFFETGDVNGLPGNASLHPQTGEAKHIADVICGSVVACGLCPGAPEGVCTADCAAEAAEE
jgi:hypothetical protein